MGLWSGTTSWHVTEKADHLVVVRKQKQTGGTKDKTYPSRA
jgi:hypothetical protein